MLVYVFYDLFLVRIDVQKDSKYTVAMMYAQALFRAALDEKCEDAVFEEMVSLKDSFDENPLLWNQLSRPIDDDNLVMPIIEQLIKKAHFSNVLSQTLRLVTENKRIGLLALIADDYKKLYYQHKGIIEVTVDTVVKLDTKQSNKLKQIMEDKLKAPVILNYRIKPEILGGLALSFDSFLIDDTLSTKIKNLEQIITGLK